jgi:hypothetical protein
MAMSVQCLRESQALHIDYYRQNEKTANLPEQGCEQPTHAAVERRDTRSSNDRNARDARDRDAFGEKNRDSEEVGMNSALLAHNNF